MGLHFFEADTPPFCGSKTLEKSEISQDFLISPNPRNLRSPEKVANIEIS